MVFDVNEEFVEMKLSCMVEDLSSAEKLACQSNTMGLFVQVVDDEEEFRYESNGSTAVDKLILEVRHVVMAFDDGMFECDSLC